MEEDDIPLARLISSKSDDLEQSFDEEDNVPLSTFINADDEDSWSEDFNYDSDTDPEFQPGKCEVRRCQEDVWAACENCEILVCYDHCIEDIRSCADHGKTKKLERQRRLKEKLKKNKIKRTSLSEEEKRILNDKTAVEESEEITTTESTETHAIERDTTDTIDNEMIQEKGDTIVAQDSSADKIVGDEEHQSMEHDPLAADGEEVSQDLTRGRKRKRNPDGWQRNIRKRLKNTGQSYISVNGKEKNARKVGPCCSSSCSLKCGSKFSVDGREELFREYWDSGDRRDQKQYILRHMESGPVQRKRIGSEKRNVTYKYFFYSQDSRLQVCRTFFMNTLDVKRDFLYETIKQLSTHGVLRKSEQGRHGQQKRIEESDINIVKGHIASFPAVESHYCRADSNKRYLDSSLSVPKMFKLYKDMCEKEGHNPVREHKYRQVFDYDFKIGFHRPKKDQCDVCISFRNKSEPSEEEKALFDSHQVNKVKARELKQNAKEEAKAPSKTSAAFDLQQILICPHGQSSSFFYKRRLGVYNLTIYDYKRGDAYCYMWPENEGKRGSTEIASCLYLYMADRSTEGVDEVDLFSDNCAGQNRNRFVAFALFYARDKFKMKRITHTFLEKGHTETETENDSVHATIERATRHIELYTPHQWYTAVRTARTSKQPYVVKEMSADDFVNFKDMASNVKNLTTDDDGEKIFWSKVRQVTVQADDPKALLIKTSYEGSYQRLDLFRRSRKSGDSAEGNQVTLQKGLQRPGIAELKKKDLISLVNGGQVPASYRTFYDSLTVGTGVSNDDDE